jgi:hypothetical protein
MNVKPSFIEVMQSSEVGFRSGTFPFISKNESFKYLAAAGEMGKEWPITKAGKRAIAEVL